MATTRRNKKIGELFLTAAGSKPGSSLVNREISLSVRVEAAETLVKIRVGLGRHSRDRLKRILKEIVTTAKVKQDETELQKLLDRIEVIRLRLETMVENRAEHEKQAKRDEAEKVHKEQQILNSAEKPFPLFPTSKLEALKKQTMFGGLPKLFLFGPVWDGKEKGFAWSKQMVDGEVVWTLFCPDSVPTFRTINWSEYEKAKSKS